MEKFKPEDLFQNGDGEWGQREGDYYVVRTYKGGKLVNTIYHKISDQESDAPKILEQVASIRLTNKQFDDFVNVCSNKEPFSDKMKETAHKLDMEGF